MKFYDKLIEKAAAWLEDSANSIEKRVKENLTNISPLPEKDRAAEWGRWDYVDDGYATDRKGRGVGGRLTVKSVNKNTYTGKYLSHDGKTIYRTTLRKCTCPDFDNRHLPCKHMYHLAYNCGLDINLDYDAILKRALNNPGANAKQYLLEDFWAYRNTFEILFADKLMELIAEDGGIIKQVDLKKYLSNDEIRFYDYTIEKMIQESWIRREKEGGRVVFYINQ